MFDDGGGGAAGSADPPGPDVGPARHRPRPHPAPDSNITAYHFKLRRGDVDAVWSRAAPWSRTPSPRSSCSTRTEPHVTIALYDASGVMTLWTRTMGAHTMRSMLADLLRASTQRVRVITNMVGGGYGSKMYLRAINRAAALLAIKVPNRHARILFDREDEFLQLREAAARRGPPIEDRREEGRHAGGAASTIYWEKGAYADIGAVIVRNASYCSLDLTESHARIDGYLVYTNRQPGGGFRGLGIPQVSWAGEQDGPGGARARMPACAPAQEPPGRG